MSILTWTYLIVGFTFSLYIGIAVVSRVRSTSDFYVAGQGVSPLANGMATGADWMSAASFISMAGLISFMGYTGAIYLMGWTGGYVLLALLLAPYLRKYGRYTVSEFVGDRYYSQTARLVAVFCAIFISFTYIAGQMRGVGVVFSRFLEVDVNTGVIIGQGGPEKPFHEEKAHPQGPKQVPGPFRMNHFLPVHLALKTLEEAGHVV